MNNPNRQIKQGWWQVCLSCRLLIPAIFFSFVLASNGLTRPVDPTLDSLIVYALAKHPDLASMKQMIEAAEARRRMARSLMSPELTFELMDVPSNFRLNEDPATSFNIGVMQEVPWPGKRRAAGEAADARWNAAGLDLDADRQNMAAMVAMAYYDLGGLNETDSLLEYGLRLTQEMTEAARWMLSGTMGAQSDIERGRLEEENWRLKIIANRGEIRRAQATLGYAIGGVIDSLMAMRIALPEDLPSLPNFDSIATPVAIDSSPLVRLALAKAEAAERDLKLAQLGWWPNMKLMAKYGIRPDLKTMEGVDHLGNPVPAGTVDQMNMISVGVSFPVPLFFKGNQRAGIAEMSAMRTSTEADVADARLAKVEELKKLHASWREQNDCCAFVRESVIVRAENLFKTTLIDYRAGKVPFMALSQARMELVMAKMELAMSRAEAWGYQAKFMAALGKLADGNSTRRKEETKYQ